MKNGRGYPQNRKSPERESAAPKEASPAPDTGSQPTGDELEPLPPEEESPEAMAAGVSAEDAAAGDQMAEAATPMAAEPISADTMSTLAAVLPEAISRITAGAITPDMVVIPQGDVAGDRLPGAAAKHLLAVAGLVQTVGGQVKGLERYALTPDELTTNNGIVEAALKVDALSRDKAILDGLATATIAPPGGQEDAGSSPDNR